MNVENLNKNPPNFNELDPTYTNIPLNINNTNFTLIGNISGYFTYRNKKIPAIIYKHKFYIIPYDELTAILNICSIPFDDFIFIPISYSFLSLPKQTAKRFLNSMNLKVPHENIKTYEDLYNTLYTTNIHNLIKITDKIFVPLLPPFPSLKLTLTKTFI